MNLKNKNLKNKALISTLSLATVFTIFSPIVSKAALQGNGGTAATNTPNGWIRAIRLMEGTGGTLGLQESINTDLTGSGDSNGLDIHMEKNTEYGAMALLSASSYGNPSPVVLNKKDDTGSTTGNKTGVMGFTTEWVANAHLTGGEIANGNWVNAKSKYKNNMALDLVGDATNETKQWHSTAATATGFTLNNDSQAEKWGGFVRANAGSIFSFSGNCTSNDYYDSFLTYFNRCRNCKQVAWAESGYGSRAVVVVGGGF